MTFNMCYTSVPILIYGIHEEYLPKEVLEANPSIYRKNSRNANMDIKRMVSWFLNGAIHGAAVYYFYIVLWKYSLYDNGLTLGVNDIGSSIFHGVIFVVNYKLFLLSQKWTIRQNIASIISVSLIFALHILWEKSPLGSLPFIPRPVIDYSYLLSNASFWFSLLILPQLALLPDAVSQAINGIYKGLAGPGASDKQNNNDE